MFRHKLGIVLAAFALASTATVVTNPAAAGAAAGPGVAPAVVADPAAGLAVSTWGTGRLDVFARGSDNTLQHRIFNGMWSAWESLGGALSSAPAATSWGPGRIDVVARSTTNTVVHRTYANGVWGAWEDLGGAFSTAPAIVAWGANRLDVFGVGTNSAMLHNSWNGTKWQTSWDSLGGTFSAAPAAASWASGRLDVFGRGAGDALFHKAYTGAWAATWDNLGGTLGSAPAATSWGANRIDVFVAGSANTLYQRTYDGKWEAWVSLGDTMTGAPAVDAWAANHLDVFYPGDGDTLMRKTFSDTWRAPVDLTGVPAPLPTQQFASVSAVQTTPAAGATVGGLEYAEVNNLGQIVWGHQPDPGNFSGVQWTVISGFEKFTGQPTLAEQPDGRLLIGAHNVDADVWTTLQTAKGASTWGVFSLAGGGLTGHPVVGKLPDGRQVIFGVSAFGNVYALPQDTVNGPFGLWKNLDPGKVVAGPTAAGDAPRPVPGDLDPADTPTLVPTRDGLQLFGLNTAGHLRTATYSAAGTLSDFTDLGGAGLNGTPSVVVYPGYLMRAFVRAADGTILTKAQNDAGTWAADWSPVGTFVSAGPPSALLSPTTGRTELVARAADGSIYSTGETATASGTWRDWVSVLLGGDVAATDPTTFTFNNGSGQGWALVFLTPDQQGRVYTVNPGTAVAARVPGFSARRLPTPAH